MLGSVLLVAMAVSEVRQDDLELVLFDSAHANRTGARCLDGSPAGYYISRDLKPEADWVVYLQGGGLCIEPIDCLKRQHKPSGSSHYWKPQHRGTNVYGNASENPLGRANRVFVPYCSGDTWQGTRKSVHLWYGGYTSGHLVLKTVLEHIWDHTPMHEAKRPFKLILSGGSAGGIGVFANADYVTDFFAERSRHARVMAVPQGGYFFPANVTTYDPFFLVYLSGGPYIPTDVFMAAYVGFFEDGFIDKTCLEANADNNKFNCWDINILAKYITTPLLVIQNQFDFNQIKNEFVCHNCTNSSKPHTTEGQFIALFGRRMRQSLQSFAGISPERNSVFMPSCFQHMNNLRIPGGSRVFHTSMSEAIRLWLEGDNFVLMDLQEPDGMPTNERCWF